MVTITFEIEASEADAVRAVTGESAQAFLERNARAHVADCVLRVKRSQLAEAGVPPQLADAGLDDDEIEAVVTIRSEKVAARKAAEAAAKAAEVAAAGDAEVKP